MSSVKHIMFLSKNVKTPLSLDVKVGFVYGLKALFKGLFLLTASIIVGCTFIKIKNGGKMKVSVFR
ncbi:hypothetical protein ACIGEH_16675, partial [Bacillus altitudinis]|uniref:hypothetical protein n=1 Tax=Bacillus altitudinis TaxID=293387 RepID=UPI0037C8391A